MICPCKDCADRKIPKTCEKECEQWKIWQEIRLAQKEKTKAEIYTSTTRNLIFERLQEKYKRKH